MLRTLQLLLVGVMVVALAAVAIAGVEYRLDILKNEKENVVLNTKTAEMRMREIECLARNIYFEAGHEPFEGKVAVAQVTLNRTESPKFPNDICQVVYQKNIIYQKVICQFSWYCLHAGIIGPKDKKLYKESYTVAQKVLLEGFRLPSLDNALFYHADYISPGWKRKQITQIGRHIFYQ